MLTRAMTVCTTSYYLISRSTSTWSHGSWIKGHFAECIWKDI